MRRNGRDAPIPDLPRLPWNGEQSAPLRRPMANAHSGTASLALQCASNCDLDGRISFIRAVQPERFRWRQRGRRPAGKSANTSPPPTRARARARWRRKSKTLAGRQGRALVDRSADPVCEKRQDPHGCPGRRDSREHQGVGLDDAGAGGRGWRADCGPRQGYSPPGSSASPKSVPAAKIQSIETVEKKALAADLFEVPADCRELPAPFDLVPATAFDFPSRLARRLQ
jgi:hypothetical protein